MGKVGFNNYVSFIERFPSISVYFKHFSSGVNRRWLGGGGTEEGKFFKEIINLLGENEF